MCYGLVFLIRIGLFDSNLSKPMLLNQNNCYKNKNEIVIDWFKKKKKNISTLTDDLVSDVATTG